MRIEKGKAGDEAYNDRTRVRCGLCFLTVLNALSLGGS